MCCGVILEKRPLRRVPIHLKRKSATWWGLPPGSLPIETTFMWRKTKKNRHCLLDNALWRREHCILSEVDYCVIYLQDKALCPRGFKMGGASFAFLKQPPLPPIKTKAQGFRIMLSSSLSLSKFSHCKQSVLSCIRLLPFSSTPLGNYQGVSVNMRRIPFSPMKLNSCPYSLAGK